MGFKMKRSNMAGGIMIDKKPDGHMPDYRAKSAPLQMKGTPNMEMKDKKKKKKEAKPNQGDFVPAYPGADISEAEYKKMKALGITSESMYSEYKTAKDKKAWLAQNVKKKTNTTTAKK